MEGVFNICDTVVNKCIDDFSLIKFLGFTKEEYNTIIAFEA